MEVIGKLVKKLDLETGTSKTGKEWQKQTAIIDTGGEFNNIIAVSAFGDKVSNLNKLEEGMNVKILCNVYSREYNGKFYHNIDGYWFSPEVQSSKDSKELASMNDDLMPF
jgi:hypothetical protein